MLIAHVFVLMLVYSVDHQEPEVLARTYPSATECHVERDRLNEAFRANPNPRLTGAAMGCLDIPMPVKPEVQKPSF